MSLISYDELLELDDGVVMFVRITDKERQLVLLSANQGFYREVGIYPKGPYCDGEVSQLFEIPDIDRHDNTRLYLIPPHNRWARMVHKAVARHVLEKESCPVQ